MTGEDKTNKKKEEVSRRIEELCLTTWENVYRFIYYKVQNREEAEDITQEAYAKTIAYLKKDGVKPDKYISFLKTVAMNLLRDKWRKKKRQGVSVNLEGINPEETATPDYSEKALEKQLIENALKGLGEEQQKVVSLRIIKGYSVAETAKMMDKGEGAVRSLQYRAIQKLSEILGNEYNLI